MAKFVSTIAGAALIGTGLFLEFVTIGASTPLTAFLISSGVGMVLSGIGTMLSRGPMAGTSTASRNPIAPWNVVYGRAKIGGALIYFGEFGDNDKYLDMVFVLACHQSKSVDALLFDGQRIQISTNAGPYNGVSGDSFTPVQQNIPISHISRANNVVTVVLLQDIPLLQAGDNVIVQNVSGDYTLNGKFPVEQIISQVYAPGTPGSVTFTYLCGGPPAIVDNEGQVLTSWPDYGAKVHMEVLLGNHTATFPGMLNGTPNDGDSGDLIQFTNNPWSAAHKCLGRTVVFLRLHYNDSYFASGLPSISFLVSGKNDISDPRTSPPTIGFTENPVLCIADYLTREEPVRLRIHWWRPWLRGGVLSRDAGTVLQNDTRATLASIDAEEDTPLAVIVRFADDEWGLFSELTASHGSRRVIQIVDHGGRLVINSSAIAQPHRIDTGGTTAFFVEASNRVAAKATDFPRHLHFRIGGTGSAANLLRVQAKSTHCGEQVQLPEPAWLRIGDSSVPTEGLLHVDVVARRGRDEWQFTVEPAQLSCSVVPQPLFGDALNRVAIVLDRTCPDWSHWSDAVRLAQERHKAPNTHPEFNAGIRRGLEAAIANYPWPAGARGRLAWFADVPDEGVAALKGVARPGRAWDVRLRDAALPGGFGASIDELTYFPGLDVWDPVDESLLETLEFFRGTDGGTLVIIGNSPPSPGPHDGPISEIATTFGFATISRRRGSRWREALDKLAQLGTEVYYVFLRLGEHDMAEVDDFGMFDALQGRVESAIRATFGDHSISVNADIEGVRAGVVEALDRARAERCFSSGVILSDFV